MTDITIWNGNLRLAASVFGSDDHPAVLLLHGLSGSRDTWQEAESRLTDRFQVWTLDFRGHGHSDRADSYLIDDYVSDAVAILDVIGRPLVIAGHSLGAVTAGVLAQRRHRLVQGVFLEDPPWYLGEAAEWDKGIYKQVFPLLRNQQAEMQGQGAPLEEWVAAGIAAPSPLGGTNADHLLPRHLLSGASARQRHDPAAWETAIDGTLFATHRPDDPIELPVTIIQADPKFGAAFMAEHTERLLSATSHANVVRYDGTSHTIHHGRASSERFLGDLDSFVSSHAKI